MLELCARFARVISDETLHQEQNFGSEGCWFESCPMHQCLVLCLQGIFELLKCEIFFAFSCLAITTEAASDALRMNSFRPFFDFLARTAHRFFGIVVTASLERHFARAARPAKLQRTQYNPMN